MLGRLQLMPGGVNSPARAFGGVGGQPIFFERGEGAYLYDLDGNRYVDYIGSWGPMILGHRHPKVVEALDMAIRKGTSFGRAPPKRRASWPNWLSTPFLRWKRCDWSARAPRQP